MTSRIFCLLFGVMLAFPAAASHVHIPGNDIRLPGEYLPPTQPNMPAILILHGCGGLFSHSGEVGWRMWHMGQLLQEMGYGVLYIDSFTPRGIKQVCTSRSAMRAIGPDVRADDASAAIRWLREQKDVDADRIGILGWSHGSDAVLKLMGRKKPLVRAAVTYYPACRLLAGDKNYRVSAPTLVLVGDADEWTPAEDCKELSDKTGQDLFHVVTYPGVFHDFDAVPNVPNGDMDIANRTPRDNNVLSVSNSEATYDANRRTFKWFARWFDPERAIKGVPPSKNSPIKNK